jgi:uncharacterized protein with PQ loop repeat
MSNTPPVINAIGYSGGMILSICLVPQIYQIIKTKQVDNISYLWQFMYIVGISLHLFYAVYLELLPIYIPTIIELIFIITLTIMKFIYTNRHP